LGGHPGLVVGIGASAGGLDAYRSFFSAMPADSGMAFVLIQHLSPDHKSILAELLGKSTAMSVIEAADGAAVKPNCVLVIPPDATMTIEGGRLKIVKPAPPRHIRRPIDTFFQSLAIDQGENAVCIILSGTGSDGTFGVAAIKEEGGLTLAQAEFDHHAKSGMPQSAAASGQVDDVLAVEEMPGRLLAYQKHLLGVAANKGGDGTRTDAASHLSSIIGALRARSGHDFSEYKEKTLVRRLQRRMQVLQVETPEAYIAQYLDRPEELDLLFRELLIGVTQFFRDTAAFDALDATVLKGLVSGKGADGSVRIWVPGCATGQEAYTIAILLCEAMDKRRPRPKIQIFGTDIDDRAIAVARAGRYRKPVAGLSPERFERWFTQEGDDCHVTPEIREMCVFSNHSVIKDPPFSKLDLISCRNLLIYIDAGMQNRVMRTFHYALKPGGRLFLGSSESVTRSTGLFVATDKKHRIFERRATAGTSLPDLPSRGLRLETQVTSDVRPTAAPDHIEKSARRVMEKYNPPHLVIDRRHQIVRLSGGAMSDYLELAAGVPSFALFDILRKPLRPIVRTVLQDVQASKAAVCHENIAVRIGESSRLVTIIAEPMVDNGAETGFVVLAFQDKGSAASESRKAPTNTKIPDAMQAVEQELQTTRNQLQSTIDELEIAGEEMKSSNEEYQSVNEELQSSNEELETSKEEMQSINEELQTINVEMTSKNDQLMRLNSDIENLLDSTEIATLFLDDQLLVKSFTRGVTDIFHVRDTDIGRPIAEIVSLLDYPDLQRDAKTVLRKLGVFERQVALKDAKMSFVLRIRPYRTIENVIDGVVVTFVDITAREAGDAALRQSQDDLRRLIDSVADGIYCIDRDCVTTLCNAAFLRMLGFADESDVIGVKLHEIIHHSYTDGSPHLRSQSPICATSQTGEPAHRDDEVFFRIDGTSFPVEYWSRPIMRGGELDGAVCTFVDISDRLGSQSALIESEGRFRAAVDAVDGVVWTNDASGKMSGKQPGWSALTGQTPDEYEGFGWSQAVHPEDAQSTVEAWNAAVAAKSFFDFEHRVRRQDGEWRNFSVHAAPIFDRENRVIEWVGVHTDITEQKEHEETRELLVRELDHRVKNLFAVVGGVVTLSARSAATPKEMVATIQGRLGALANAHVLIRPNVSTRVSGAVATRRSTLRELVQTILAPYTDVSLPSEIEPSTIEGPEVEIGGEAVTSLALILHELATNTAKYGAFSTPNGCLHISWEVANGELALTWKERGGPIIDHPPEREGFGSLLVRRSVNGQLRGTLTFDWNRDGLIVRLTAKAERLLQ
jgi:two-component system CheB/CheR fusion protein